MNTKEALPSLYTVNEVAEACGVKPATVRRWMHDGKLVGRRIGKRSLRVERGDLDDFLRASEGGVMPANSYQRWYAEQLVDLLVDHGPLTKAECCERLGWPLGRFDTAMKAARTEVCPALELVIPNPVPWKHWTYEVTTDWAPVAEGTAHALGQIETRLSTVHGDIRFIKPLLTRGSKAWRRANFLDKHLAHITSTMEEINGDKG